MPPAPPSPVPDICVSTVPNIRFGGTGEGLLGLLILLSICFLQLLDKTKTPVRTKNIYLSFFIFFFFMCLERKIDVEAIAAGSRGLQSGTAVLRVLIHVEIFVAVGEEIEQVPADQRYAGVADDGSFAKSAFRNFVSQG